jgi:hypothetical protein
MSEVAISLTEQTTASIMACKYWNITNIILEAGREYEFAATGTWSDASIVCDAAGYPPPISPPALGGLQTLVLKAFEPFRRVRSAPWFALIGAIDKDMDTAFMIGRNTHIKITKTGVLTCFANDVPIMYWNNKGSLTLSVAPRVG